MTMDEKYQEFCDFARKVYGENLQTITRVQVQELVKKHHIKEPTWLFKNVVERGVYRLPDVGTVPVEQIVTPLAPKNSEAPNKIGLYDDVEEFKPEDESWVPAKDALFRPCGEGYNELVAIIKSGHFFPTWIAGPSGAAKTLMAEQACAELNREYIRVPITIETDEDELLGGFRLINGKTEYFKGPVVLAMERGAICNLDEVEKATGKIMCLQPILEGKPILLKRINKLVYPAPGFNLIATANTKGQGSEDGKFVTSQVLDEAFLERWLWTIEQDYPDRTTEKKILNDVLNHFGSPDDNFADCLSQWAEVIRLSVKQGATDQTMATRRLTGICHAYAIFGKTAKKKCVLGALKRFNEVTRNSFSDLYNGIDSTVDPGPTSNSGHNTAPSGAANDPDLTPF
jgi:hypothetical protein